MFYKIDVNLPDDYKGREPTEEEILDWVCFNVMYTSGLSGDNPLARYDLNCKNCFKEA